jgi:hypothetical protein
MRTVYFKTTEDTLVNFTSNNTSIPLSDNLPFGVGYREECSCELPQTDINSWWDYVDILKVENPIDNFNSVWRITEGENLYGFSNNL